MTLVGEGLTLPAVVRVLGLANAGRRERQAEREEEFKVRRRAVEAAIERLEALDREPQASPSRWSDRSSLICATGSKKSSIARTAMSITKSSPSLATTLELSLIEAERDLVNKLYRAGELKDEGRRRIERELDLRDTLLASLRSTE